MPPRPRARYRRRHPRDQRGVTAVLVALMLSLLLVVTALAVDIGMQRVLRSDLQAMADVVALDLSRELTAKKVSAYTATELAALDAAKTDSVRRNQDAIGGPVDPADLSWEFVVRDDDTGEFVRAAGDDIPTAIRVAASSSVGFAFSGITGVTEGSATRSAVASAPKVACIAVSSYAAHLDTERSWLLDFLLGDLLGSDLALTLLDPQNGLLDTQVNLLDLIDELDPLVAADISALSFTQGAGVGVGLSQLTLAVINVLERESGRTAEVDLLRQVLGGIQANVPNLDVTLGDLIELDTAGEAAVGLDVNVFDLITGGLAVANGTNVIDLPLGVNLPLPIGAGGQSLASLEARVTVGQQPVVSCTGRAESSQIVITLTGDVANVDIGIAAVQIPISLKITLADASAEVRNVRCIAPGHKAVDLAIDSGLLSVDLWLGDMPGDADTDELAVTLLGFGAALPGWRGIEVVAGTVGLTSGQSTSRPTLERTIQVHNENYDLRIPAAEGGLGVPTLHASVKNLRVLSGLPVIGPLLEFLGIGSLLQGIVNLVLEGVVNPLVSTLDRWLLDPLLRTLGIDLAGGTVEVRPTAECGSPRLIG